MTMKNPPHPGVIVLEECIEPMGLTHHECRSGPWSDAEHTVRTGKREARHIS